MTIKYTKEILAKAVSISTNYSEVVRNLNGNPSGGTRDHIKNRIILYKIDTSHFDSKPKMPTSNISNPDTILVKTSNNIRTKGHRLKKAMLSKGISYKCAGLDCPNPYAVWAGKPLVLQVDHIDGDYTNNILKNLRFLCPNCHSQTPTFSRSKKEKYCSCGSKIQNRSKNCQTCAKIKHLERKTNA